MGKESFIIYKSFYAPIKSLSDKQLGRLFRALFDYQIEGSTQVDADLKMVFAFFKNQMDIDNGKYQKVVERNKQNGSKGGRPSKEENPKNPVGFKKPKKPDNDNDNDNDINIRGNKLPLCEGNPHAENLNYEKLVDFFNSETKGVFGKVIYPISETRKKSVKARIAEHGKERFAEVIKRAGASDFLKGQNQRGFTATFDWIIKPTNFDKILSGNYDNNKNYGTHQQTGRKTITDDELLQAVASGIARAEFEKNRQ